jgi:hypothetical protein
VHHPGEPRHVDLSLDQEVLGAGLDAFGPDLDVVQAGEDDHRNPRGMRCGTQAEKRLQALAIRQGQVEQHDVDPARRQALDPSRQAIRTIDLKRPPLQNERELLGLGRAVFDNKYA